MAKTKNEIEKFKSQYKGNEQIVEGIYKSGKTEIHLDDLKEYGFDINELKGSTDYGSSVLLSATQFENHLIGDYELMYLKEKSRTVPFFKIVKIKFDCIQIILSATKLIQKKKEIENSLWAYKFDSEIANPGLAIQYEEKKKEIEKLIFFLIKKFDTMLNSMKDTVNYLDGIKQDLNKLE